MRFKYLDRVTVTSGFYEGVVGKLTSCDEHYGMDSSEKGYVQSASEGSQDSVRYCVELPNKTTIMLNEDLLELVNNKD